MFSIDNPFTMVVLIVAIVFGAKIWRTHMITRSRDSRPRQEDAALMATLTAQVERLSDRIAVLEKLATDDDRQLATEIERLRKDSARDVSL